MLELLLTLAAWAVLNILVTRRVLATSRDLYLPTRMLLGTIWLLPFIGALMAFVNTPSPRVAARVVDDATPRADGSGDALPDLIPNDAGGPPFPVVQHLRVALDLPLLDWAAFEDWVGGAEIAGGTPAQSVVARERARQAWLRHLGAALNPGMRLHVTDDACVLSSLNDRQQRGLSDYVRTARQRVRSLLGDLARFPDGERSLVLVMDHEAQYYRYVSLYYPEGEFATSGGMFIDAGCPHFVVVRAHLNVIEPVIAHELTHAALSHLKLPRWLDEGIAVNAERRIAGPQPSLYTPHELHDMHLAHWNAAKIQAFWSGEAFLSANDDPLLAYELARIIVEQFARDWNGFLAFVRAVAFASDAGAAAALQTLGLELGEVAAALVESPTADGWTPAEPDESDAQEER